MNNAQRLAEFLGWPVDTVDLRDYNGSYPAVIDGIVYYSDPLRKNDFTKEYKFPHPWQPETNRDQCAMLEERVFEDDALSRKYICALVNIFDETKFSSDPHISIHTPLITATPQQRCEALLKVIGEKE